MTTIITLSHDTNNLPEIVRNWNEINNQTKEFMLATSDFRIYSPQELLLYKERKIVASCSIFYHENDTITIENCWTEQGNLF